MFKFKVEKPFKKLREMAEAKILDVAKREMSNADKFDNVVATVSNKLDELITFGNGPVGAIAEAIDGPVIKAIVSALVQDIFDDLRAAGKV